MDLPIKDLYPKTPPPTPVEVAQVITAQEVNTRPPTQVELRNSLRRALNAVTPPAELRAIMARLVAECKVGNMGALKILTDLLMGKPELELQDHTKTRMLTPTEVDEALRNMGYERKL